MRDGKVDASVKAGQVAQATAELQPEAFVEIPPELAADKGLRHLDWVVLSTARGRIRVKALLVPATLWLGLVCGIGAFAFCAVAFSNTSSAARLFSYSQRYLTLLFAVIALQALSK